MNEDEYSGQLNEMQIKVAKGDEGSIPGQRSNPCDFGDGDRGASRFDAATAIQKRCVNFAFLHERMLSSFAFALSDDDVPMVYPYVTDDATLRTRLIDRQIYVAKYWPGLSHVADVLAERIIPLPIDQRYGEEDVQRIMEEIHG